MQNGRWVWAGRARKLHGSLRMAAGTVLALVLMIGFAGLLRLIPIRVLLRGWGKPVAVFENASPASFRDEGRARAIRHAIARAAELSPFRADCLPQALVAVTLARWRNIPATAYLGGRTEADGTFRAHAWVTCGTIVISGLAGLASYKPLACFLFGSAQNGAALHGLADQ